LLQFQIKAKQLSFFQEGCLHNKHRNGELKNSKISSSSKIIMISEVYNKKKKAVFFRKLLFSLHNKQENK